MQRHAMSEIVNHSRSQALERSVKHYWGRGGVGVGGGGGGGGGGRGAYIPLGINAEDILTRVKIPWVL